MKKITIDITHFDRLSGYWVVTRNIIKWILEKDKNNFYYLISNSYKNLDSLEEFKNFEFINTNENFILYKFFSLPRYLKKYKIDIFLSLDQDLPLMKVCKYICVSHDIWAQIKGKKNMIKQLFTPWTDKLDRIYHLIDIEKVSLNKADFIFVPSLNTKNDLINHYKIPENKIILNHWWINHMISENAFEKQNKILFPYSNLYSDFQYRLANKLTEDRVVDKIIFLRPAFIDENLKLNKNIEIIKWPIDPKDNEKYYKESLLSVYLSDYDWFGFVPLESMFYQIPVIYNIHSCMSEISWKWWVWIKNMDIDIFYEQIKELLKNREFYNNLIERWIENIEKFKWTNTINKFLEIFNKLKNHE